MGGFIVATIPDEDLYEKGIFPSVNNSDHRNTFTIYKDKSWCDKSINVIDLVRDIGSWAEAERIIQQNSFYDYSDTVTDQTIRGDVECSIEIVLRKTSHEGLPHN